MIKQLNVVKIIKNTRNQKIISMNSILTNELKQQLKHAEQALINLEDSSDVSSGTNNQTVEELDLKDSEADFEPQ